MPESMLAKLNHSSGRRKKKLFWWRVCCHTLSVVAKLKNEGEGGEGERVVREEERDAIYEKKCSRQRVEKG